MHTTRGHHHTIRDKENMRTSRNHRTFEEAALGFRFNPTPSVSSATSIRRPRGFQPSEVNKAKADVEVLDSEASTKGKTTVTATNSSKADPDSKPLFSAVDPDSKPSSSAVALREDGLKENVVPRAPKFKTQPFKTLPASKVEKSQLDGSAVGLGPRASAKVSGPTLDSKKTSHLGNSKATDSSQSVDIIVNDESQKLHTSKGLALPISSSKKVSQKTPEAAWDDSTNPIDSPSWRRESASHPDKSGGAVGVNWDKLGRYKSPFKTPSFGSGKKKDQRPTPTSLSFDRQLANINKSKQAAEKARLQEISVATHADIQPKAEAFEKASDDFPKESSVKNPSFSESSKVAHNTKSAKKSRPVIMEQNYVEQEKKVAPHLRKLVAKSEGNAQNEHVEKATPSQSPAASKNAGQPPHLQGRNVGKEPANTEAPSETASVPHEAESNPTVAERTINIDEELAAGQHLVNTNNDATIAAAIADENDANDEQIAAALREAVSENDTDIHTGKMTHETEGGVKTIPPHLRKFKQSALTLDTNPKSPSSVAVQSDTTQQEDKYIAAATPSPVAKNPKNRYKAMESPVSGAPHSKGTGTKALYGKATETDLDPENDPSKLVGWDGKMMPAMLDEDWADRPRYNSKGKEKLAVIKNWTETHAAGMEAGAVASDEILSSPIDTQHPETIPNPDEFNQAKRHLSAVHAIEAFEKRSASEKLLEGQDGMRHNRRNRREVVNSEEFTLNAHAIEANIYLRPAEMKDMGQVTMLHNHYVQNSTCANEWEENDEIYWRQRFQESFEERDPFLVAVHNGDKAVNDIQNLRRKRSETIVGFAFAADYGVQKTAYRFTVELEAWVHPAHTGKGIGKAMLDRMLSAMDPGYNTLDCAPFLAKKQELLKWRSGGTRVIKTMLVNLLYSEASVKALEWKKKWLEDKNFECEGTLSDLGYKFGTTLHQCQMTYKTMASLPPSAVEAPSE